MFTPLNLNKKLIILLVVLLVSVIFLIYSRVFFADTITSPTNVTTRNDGTTLINNQPFFPLGFFHVSWAGTPEKRLSDMRTMAAAGFNFLNYETISADDSSIDQLLTEAESLGMYIMPGGVNPRIAGANMDYLNRYISRKALLGYYIADDANCGSNPPTPEQIKNVNLERKADDPSRITLIALCNYNNLSSYMNISDAVGIENYPIPNEPLDSTNYAINTVTNAAKPYNRPVWGLLQSFPWTGQRPPTLQEIRIMTYASIIDGVKGIVYYSYFDTSWDIAQQPAFWQNMKTIPPEVNKITPYILNGVYSKINTGLPDAVYAASWRYNNKMLVLAENSTTTPRNISLTLPQTPTGNLSELFANSTGLTLQGSNLVGTIGSNQVMAYLIDTAALSDTISPSVSITTPMDNALIAGTIPASATATDNLGVTKVEFYRDNTTLIGTDNTAPYSIPWDTKSLINGNHILTVKAYDSAGNTGTSNRTVTINNALAPEDSISPSVSISSPLNSSIFKRRSTINISAIASDNISVTKVEFWINDKLTCTDTTAPYSCNYRLGGASKINYNLQAKAYDTKGNIGNSQVVSIKTR